VWQIYDYDLEPMSSFFGVMHASESQHIQFNESNGQLEVINNLPTPIANATARVSIYNLDDSVAYHHEIPVTAPAEAVTDLGPVEFPAALSAVHFLKLELHDTNGNLLSSNFYWRAQPDHPDDLTALNQLPVVTLEAKAERKDECGKRLVTVTLHNPTATVALMAHLQLRRSSGERVLPVYYDDNYVSLAPNETRTITIEAALSDFNGEAAQVVLDGWNVTVAPSSFTGVSVAPDLEAQPGRWPLTGLPFQTSDLR
jgi:hypothetical protein